MGLMNVMRLNAVRTEMLILEERIERMEKGGVPNKDERLAKLRASAASKIATGSTLTRAEAAAHLGMSERKLLRMDPSSTEGKRSGCSGGLLARCPGYGSSVVYAARDVQRLASAMGKES